MTADKLAEGMHLKLHIADKFSRNVAVTISVQFFAAIGIHCKPYQLSGLSINIITDVFDIILRERSGHGDRLENVLVNIFTFQEFNNINGHE